MGKTARFSGVMESRAAGSLNAWGTVLMVQRTTFDPTAAAAAIGIYLPKGAVISGIVLDGGATGGTNPTVDVGIAGDTDAYLNEGDADGAAKYTIGSSESGASFTGAVLAAETQLWAGVGASAATGGTVTIAVEYFVVAASAGDGSAA